MRRMSSKMKKLTECIKQLEANSEVDGCALVSVKGQVMASALHKDVDEKAVSAMAAALVSIGSRVGSALDSGTPKNIAIEGSDKTVIVRRVVDAALIATAPSGAKIGLIDFEMDRTVGEIKEIL
jgi:predicted regulator of Ras-like GTPase activity (Roadblock/LC7/MglB family)